MLFKAHLLGCLYSIANMSKRAESSSASATKYCPSGTITRSGWYTT